MKRYFVECLGTFFLVFAICLTGQPLAIGLMFSAMIYMGYHLAGGCYNPAITVALWIRGQLNLTRTIFYILAQYIGAFAAAATFNVLSNNSYIPTPLQHIQLWEAISMEALLTFVLCSVALVMLTSDHLRGNHVYGLVIGLTLTALIFAGTEISGGAFNPAVGVGPILYDTIRGGTSLKHLMVYIPGPFLGGIFAALVYKFTNSK